MGNLKSFTFSLLITVFGSASCAWATTPSPFYADLETIRAVSPILKTRDERLNAAAENLFSRRLFWTPSLSVSAGQQKLSLLTAQFSPVQDYDFWKTSIGWNLFRGGADLDLLKESRLNEKAARLQLADENLKLEMRAAALIFHQLYLNDTIETSRRLVQLREESHRIVFEKYKQGKAPQQEVSKSEIDQSQQMTRLRSLEIQQLENRAEWKALLTSSSTDSKTPGQLQTQAWPFTSEQKMRPPKTGLTPETESLSNLATASESRWKSVKADHWPTLDLNGEYLEYPLSDRSNRQWTASLQLTLPIWSRYQTAAASASAFADYISLKNQFEDARRLEAAKQGVLGEKIELARKNLTDARGNFQKSEVLYRDMLKSFRYGRMSMNELLIEQNRLIESQLNLSQSQWDFHKILMESCAVSGLQVRDCLE